MQSEPGNGKLAAGKKERASDPPRRDWRRFLPRKRTLFLITLIAHLLGAAASVHAVMNVRSSQAAIAWMLGLNTMPYVAIPLYLVFGNDEFAGYVEARRIAEREFSESAAAAFEYVRQFDGDRRQPGSEGPLTLQQPLSQVPALGGNQAEILVDGEETFPSIFEGIARAREYVLVQFYIIRDDRTGRRFQQLLMDKAREGVPLYLLYDEFGSQNLPDEYLEQLREAGVQVSSFNSSQGIDGRFQINFRNHRKVVVVDGKEAWMGGLNIGDEYLGEDPDYGYWRDTHLHIVGPAALPAQLTFLEDWYWATGEVLELRWERYEPEGGNLPVQLVPSGPSDARSMARMLFLQEITSATERLWIASPYFVPDNSITSALELASMRGVDIKILISDSPGCRMCYFAAHTYLDELKHTDIEFYMYDEYLHEKVLLKDDSAAIIGSVNLDNRSLHLNFELSALIRHEEFARRVERMLQEDLANSTLMGEDAYTAKPLWFRFTANLTRLAAPLL